MKNKKTNEEKKEKKKKYLLFCDNPACFAKHLAKKNYGKKNKKEKKIEKRSNGEIQYDINLLLGMPNRVFDFGLRKDELLYLEQRIKALSLKDEEIEELKPMCECHHDLGGYCRLCGGYFQSDDEQKLQKIGEEIEKLEYREIKLEDYASESFKEGTRVYTKKRIDRFRRKLKEEISKIINNSQEEMDTSRGCEELLSKKNPCADTEPEGREIKKESKESPSGLPNDILKKIGEEIVQKINDFRNGGIDHYANLIEEISKIINNSQELKTEKEAGFEPIDELFYAEFPNESGSPNDICDKQKEKVE